MFIPITCDVHDSAKIADLCIIQGNLKSMQKETYEKMKESFKEFGFSFPFHVWEDNGKLNLIDGTHRKKAIEMMVKEGFTFDENLPIVKVHAANIHEAKKKILAISSSYAKFSKEGLYEFISDIPDIEISDLADKFELEAIDFSKFGEEFFEEESEPLVGENEFSKEIDEKNDYIVLLFNNKEKFKSACEKLDIKNVQHNPSASEHEAFALSGLGRIIDGEVLLERL